MKSFLAALGFFVVALGISALIFSATSTSTTAAFSVEQVRIDHPAAADGRLGWATPGEES